MSYIALARTWRPRTFTQLIGQDHINKALINSLNKQRLHHAYLFTGTRGVGKTSIARLLAKALNCECGISAEPCLKCDACVAIEQGRFVDLIEIDGASRTRVEDTRDILENVQYAPTSGRFKIYIIDEVHMLSQHSFNALLKTLEEPPSHVKFILATTDPQKLPVTVLSRCLQFNLKHLQPNLINTHLQHILEHENISFDESALTLLATAARGSMRDALSLLDQTIASCDQHMRTQDVKNILGYTQQNYAIQLLDALAALSPETLLTISKSIADEGGNFRYVLDEILSYLHQISVSHALPNTHALTNITPEIITLKTQFTPEDTQLFYQIALKGTQDMLLAPTMAIGFEMTMLRMYTFKPAVKELAPPMAYTSKSSSIVIPTTFEPHTSSIDLSSPTSTNNKQNLDAIIETNMAISTFKPIPENSWSNIISQLNLHGLARSAAEHAEFICHDKGMVSLRIEKGHQSLFTSSVLNRIEQGLTTYYNEQIKISLSLDDKVQSSPILKKQAMQKEQHENADIFLQNDMFFQQIQQNFSAEIIKNSITPLKSDL